VSIDVGHRRAGSVTFVAWDALRYALVGSVICPELSGQRICG
jgi:hypothetical protein